MRSESIVRGFERRKVRNSKSQTWLLDPLYSYAGQTPETTGNQTPGPRPDSAPACPLFTQGIRGEMRVVSSSQ